MINPETERSLRVKNDTFYYFFNLTLKKILIIISTSIRDQK